MANLVEKTIHMTRADIIRYQLLTHCFVKKIKASDSEIYCLSLLGGLGETELADFCEIAVDKQIFKSSQTVRNFISKAERKDLIVKNGTSRKKIQLNPELEIKCQGTTLLNFKIVYFEAKEP